MEWYTRNIHFLVLGQIELRIQVGISMTFAKLQLSLNDIDVSMGEKGDQN